LIVEWAREHLGLDLFPWQQRALEQAFAHREDGSFVHSRSITSTARQNGKTTMLAALVGWALTELPRIWGRPVRVLNVAHELALATEVWEALSDTMELWAESGIAKVTWAYGRNKVEMADKSRWVVKAATGKKHGGTYDLIIADELWALSEPAVFGALLPSQIAVPSPHFFATSTAGDEGSRVMLRMREQALALIDKGEQGTLSLCEWSLPPDVNPWDQTNWGWANPAMPMTINLQGLHDAAASPDKTSFLRAHCNLWVSAANAWIAPGVWARLETDDPVPAGGVLAVDSSVDETRYVGALVASDGENIVASVGLVAEHTADLWAEVEAAMTADPALQLAVTPSLELMLPEKWRKRTIVWGYGELLKATPLVRNLIAEGRLRHRGEQMLAEHVNRAVLVRANGSVVVSSQKSPGPIELCRCLIAAAGYVVKPKNAGKPSLGIARK
jgi:phage terminase large subunit-like protein